MTLWTASEAADATGGTVTGNWKANGVSIDTRTLQPGDLFVALKAARDGHEFVAQALEKGAAAALVSHVPDGVDDTSRLLLVKDVLAALEALGKAARARTQARIVAITGSVGKTSTKEMMRDVLSTQGRTHAAEASYNNHWGVPLTLARMPADTEFAVIEIGMNHPGEIAPLARMTRPHVAMITTVAPAHLEAFENIDGIAHEKAAIFDGLESGGVAVINADLETTPILTDKAQRVAAQIVTFGESGDYGLDAATLSGGNTVVQAHFQNEKFLFKIKSMGRHFAMNGLGVLAACAGLGADVGLAAIGLGTWLPPKGRGTIELVRLDPADDTLSLQLIDDAFNANPTSMAAAFEVLAATQPVEGVGRVARGRRIAILGDMLELGPDEQALHAGIADLPQIEALHEVHCVGPRMRALWEALPENKRGHWVDAAEELADQAHRMIDAGDVVLVKGSKGSRVSLVVDALRKAGRTIPGEQEDL